MRPIITDGVTASSAHMSRPFGSDCSCSILKFCCTRVALVSITGDGAAHRHGFLQRGQRELDIELRRKAERDRDAVALQGVESAKLEGHGVGAGRHRGEPIVPGLAT